MRGWEGALRNGGARLMGERGNQPSFVACVDKYVKMSSLRDWDIWVFRMIIICPLSCNELLVMGWDEA